MDNLQLTTANIVFGTKKQSGGRKTRSNKGVKRGKRTGRTRSGRRFRHVAAKRTVRRSTSNKTVRRTRKQRSNKGVKRGPYGKRTGRTRSGRRFRQGAGAGTDLGTVQWSAWSSEGGTTRRVGGKIGLEGDGTWDASNSPSRLAFSTMSGSTLAKALTINSSGDSDFEGNYIVNEQGRQDHVANTMPAPYYRFDDVNDYIAITSFPLIAQTSASGGYSIECLFRYSTGSGSWRALFEFGDQTTGERRSLVLNGSKLAVAHFGDNHTATTDLVDGQVYHAVGTVSSAGAITMYLNGVAEAISSGDGTAALTSYSGTTAYIGRTGSGEYLGGEIHHVKVFNHALTATEVKELSSGASVPYKYKGANQTELVTNGGFGADTDWTKGSGVTIAGGKLVFNTSGTVNAYQALTTTVGKKYAVTYTISDYTSGSIKVRLGDVAQWGTTRTANGTYTDIFTGESVKNLVIECVGASVLKVDDVKATQIGAVAEYDGSGASEEHWFDTSGNDLHGDVTGATLNNQGDGGATKSITLTPRALPSTANASEGQIVYDSSANKLKVYNGSAWETITSS